MHANLAILTVDNNYDDIIMNEIVIYYGYLSEKVSKLPHFGPSLV